MRSNEAGSKKSCKCSDKCCAWATPQVGGVVVLLAALGLTFGLIGFFSGRFAIQTTEYKADQSILGSGTTSHVVTADSQITVILPNNMFEYIGKTYHFDCGTPFAHVLEISVGSPTSTTWNGVHKKVKCTTMGNGLTFHVVGQYYLRIIGTPVGMTFF